MHLSSVVIVKVLNLELTTYFRSSLEVQVAQWVLIGTVSGQYLGRFLKVWR